jgi:hypothetical protein
MRVPILRAGRTLSWAHFSQAMVQAAAAVAIVAASGIRIAASGASAAVVPADVRSIATELGAAATKDPGGSCSADVTALPPVAMFGAVGAVGAAAGTSAPSAPLVAMCALPPEHREHEEGEECSEREHLIKYQVLGAGPNAKITAELMGLDTKGNLLKSFLVKNGDEARLASELSRHEWRFSYNQREHEYTVVAPVPLLHVTVEDQGQRAEAFCSTIPWVEVVQPQGAVVSASSTATNVLAAVPLTNPSSLHLYVDGGDLLTSVPNYLGCTPLSPCNGTATINGQPLSYTNLIVDIASNISSLSSNTVRVTLQDLSCGGHVFNVSAHELDLDKEEHHDGRFGEKDEEEHHDGRFGRGDEEEHDDRRGCFERLADKGTSSVFAISITDPVPGEITPIVPTPVAGQVCSGTQIVDVNINGKTLSVAGETHVAGNGTTTGDVYTVAINTTLDQTDLVRDVLQTHDAPLGTFDAGTNRLAVSAREIGGNRTYKNLIFATGAVAPIGIDPNARVFQSAAIQAAVNDQLKQLVQDQVQIAMDPASTDLQNAFIVGLSAAGTQTLFSNLCNKPLDDPTSPFNGMTPAQIFKKKITDGINSIGQQHIKPSVPCASDPDVTLSITNVSVGNNFACNTDFHDGFFHVTVGLPDIHVDVHAYGTGGDWGDTICVEGVKVEGDAFADVTGINLGFDVTENNLLTNTFSNSNFNAGATAASNGSVGVDFCGLSVLCNVVVTIFTFGAVDINPHIDFSTVQDFSTQIGASQPDPVKLKQIKVDEQVVANFDQKVSGAVTEVHISPAGITAGLKGTFATTVVDAGVAQTPGIILTPAPVPTMSAMQSQGAQDALIGLSDDAINMMFASLTAAGKLKAGDDQGCFDTGANVGSLLPADCDTLTVDNPPGLATAAARGYCHAIKGDNCDTLTFTGNGFLTSTEQGVCHGALGDTCSTISPTGDLVKIGACLITPDLNLHASEPLLFCAKGDVPPRMLFPNTGTPGSLVPTALRLNDFTVALVIDRDGNHKVDGALAAVPGCFTPGVSNAVDCNVFSACLDLNLNFGMQFLNTCPGGKPGFKSVFDSVQILNRQIGVVCSGATSATSDGNVLNSASNDTITIPIATNAGQLSPDICGAGLDLGGFVTCAAPDILTIGAGVSPDLRDYIGITCKLQ